MNMTSLPRKLGEEVREKSTAIKGTIIDKADGQYVIHFHDDETGMKWIERKKEDGIF